MFKAKLPEDILNEKKAEATVAKLKAALRIELEAQPGVVIRENVTCGNFKFFNVARGDVTVNAGFSIDQNKFYHYRATGTVTVKIERRGRSICYREPKAGHDTKKLAKAMMEELELLERGAAGRAQENARHEEQSAIAKRLNEGVEGASVTVGNGRLQLHLFKDLSEEKFKQILAIVSA